MDNKNDTNIYQAWKNYVVGEDISKYDIRNDVLNSWNRSLSYKVDPYQKRVQDILRISKLKQVRDENELLLSYAEPRMKELAKSLYGSDAVVTISDKNGVIVNTFGDSSILKKSDDIGLIPGSVWNEKVAGTNAVGVVLKTKQPIQILYNEHFSVGWHDWSSTAAPIFHPLTNELLGVYDIAGTFKGANKQTLQLVILKTQIIAQDLSYQISQKNIQQNPYLSTLIHSASDALVILDKDKQITQINKKMESIFKGKYELGLFLFHNVNQPIELILSGKEKEYETSIKVGTFNYILNIFPLMFDNIVNGVLISLKPNKEIPKNQKHQNNPNLYNFNDIIGESRPIINAINRANKASKLDVNLFISGETGTGKELFTQSIHQASSRSKEPFIAINCSAIPKELIESELFGYEAGAFTGASNKGKIGKFEQAQNGTLFLDEIGDMPLDVQVRILRVLEEKVITRLGGDRVIPLNIRLICATHKNLAYEVEQKRFREDLYYRLNVIDINLPPLRDRGLDIIKLAQKFSSHYQELYKIENFEFHNETIDLLLKYQWPGNVRELKNVIQQTLFNLNGEIIKPEHLPPYINNQNNELLSEKEKLIDAVYNYQGDIDLITKELKISRATYYRKLKQYNLTREQILRK